MFKKLLILVTAAAIYLHYYPQPELDKKLVKYSQELSDSMAETFGTKITRKASKVYDDLSSQFRSFSAEEQEHLKEVTLNRDSVKNFHSQYCNNTAKRHPVFLFENQRKVCSTIDDFLSQR